MKPAELIVGTYTHTNSLGIYRVKFDPNSMSMDTLSIATDIQNPTFLAIRPNASHVFAVSEIPIGLVYSYQIGGDGDLTLQGVEETGGAGPCHIELNRDGTSAVVSNYEGGSTAFFEIAPDGRIKKSNSFFQHYGSSVDGVRQTKPHVHSAIYSLENDEVFVADLGIDKIVSYGLKRTNNGIIPDRKRVKSTGIGFGPRHFCWHPSGRYLYCINELDSSISTFIHAADGFLTHLQTVSTIPSEVSRQNTCADIHISPDGKYVYGSNRGHDSIAIFAVDSLSGELTFKVAIPSGGNTPRNFALTPDGRFIFVANQDSNNIVIFEREATTGLMNPTGVETQIPLPVCIKFLPDPCITYSD